ncbi:hypothetical protein B9Z55_028256 [Caenorhabditis nigoni]|uniref:PAZ domain-containing protein n=1 Tax=Caenorhabditis nigoni TaxID=1611254 RepID=A0A2G5SCD7_9PELO|nr:hypothetical protein B9Z55_028256 [Caenorhabditis nigoni]
MFIFAFNYLDALSPGWERLPLFMVNLRLRRRGAVNIQFLHRDANGLRGIPQLSRWNAHQCEFYWAEYGCTVSVYEYFYIKYGFEIRRPYDRLVFLDGAADDVDATDSSNLFPIEVMRVSME